MDIQKRMAMLEVVCDATEAIIRLMSGGINEYTLAMLHVIDDGYRLRLQMIAAQPTEPFDGDTVGVNYGTAKD